MKKAGEVCTVKWPLKSGVATKQIGIVASGGSNIDATLEQRRRRRRSKRQVLRDATRAHESFIQSVVVGAIKTLMLVRRWRQRAVFYAIDSSSLQWPTPSVSLSLSLWLSPHDVSLSLHSHTRASVIITSFISKLSSWIEIQHYPAFKQTMTFKFQLIINLNLIIL